MRATFDDGDVIDQHPTKEDPVIYYVPSGEWARAIGMLVNPLYEEGRAAKVASSLLATSNLSAADDATLRRLVARLVQVLSKQNPAWSTWTAEWPAQVIERVGEGAIRKTFEESGWRQQGANNGVIEWTR